MRTIFITILLGFVGIHFTYSQENQDTFTEPSEGEVAIIVFGEGPTKEVATQSALRNAIEQTYGTFVSSNTKILDDELVRDEIITVSSGNILSYNYIYERQRDDSSYEVTIRAIVSYKKLTAFVKNKGGSAELSLSNIVENFKIDKFYAENEKKVFNNMLKQIWSICNEVPYYDMNIKVSPPEQINEDGSGSIRCTLIPTLNSNAANIYDLFWNTVKGLAVKKNLDKQGLLQYGSIVNRGEENFRLYTKYDTMANIVSFIEKMLNEGSFYYVWDNLAIRGTFTFGNITIQDDDALRRDIFYLNSHKKESKKKDKKKEGNTIEERIIYHDFPTIKSISNHNDHILGSTTYLPLVLRLRPTKEGMEIQQGSHAFSLPYSSQDLEKLSSVNVSWLKPDSITFIVSGDGKFKSKGYDKLASQFTFYTEDDSLNNYIEDFKIFCHKNLKNLMAQKIELQLGDLKRLKDLIGKGNLLRRPCACLCFIIDSNGFLIKPKIILSDNTPTFLKEAFEDKIMKDFNYLEDHFIAPPPFDSDGISRNLLVVIEEALFIESDNSKKELEIKATAEIIEVYPGKGSFPAQGVYIQRRNR